jgi:hypothetical protein
VNGLWHNPIVHIHAAALSSQKARCFHLLEMVIHRGLAEIKHRGKITRAGFLAWLVEQKRKQLQTGWVRQGFKSHCQRNGIVLGE